jgi:hypothetical protein
MHGHPFVRSLRKSSKRYTDLSFAVFLILAGSCDQSCAVQRCSERSVGRSRPPSKEFNAADCDGTSQSSATPR